MAFAVIPLRSLSYSSKCALAISLIVSFIFLVVFWSQNSLFRYILVMPARYLQLLILAFGMFVLMSSTTCCGLRVDFAFLITLLALLMFFDSFDMVNNALIVYGVII